jgi:hypothetical protein
MHCKPHPCELVVRLSPELELITKETVEPGGPTSSLLSASSIAARHAFRYESPASIDSDSGEGVSAGSDSGDGPRGRCLITALRHYGTDDDDDDDDDAIYSTPF